MDNALREKLLAISGMDLNAKVDAINEVKALLKEISPFTTEPVECVQWVKADQVIANDYNPNSVAPPRNGAAARFHPGGRLHPADCCMAA